MPKKYATRFEQLTHKKRLTVEERYELRAIEREMILAYLAEVDEADADEYAGYHSYTAIQRGEIDDEAERDYEIMRRYHAGESIRKLENDSDLLDCD